MQCFRTDLWWLPERSDSSCFAVLTPHLSSLGIRSLACSSISSCLWPLPEVFNLFYLTISRCSWALSDISTPFRSSTIVCFYLPAETSGSFCFIISCGLCPTPGISTSPRSIHRTRFLLPPGVFFSTLLRYCDSSNCSLPLPCRLLSLHGIVCSICCSISASLWSPRNFCFIFLHHRYSPHYAQGYYFLFSSTISTRQSNSPGIPLLFFHHLNAPFTFPKYPFYCLQQLSLNLAAPSLLAISRSQPLSLHFAPLLCFAIVSYCCSPVSVRRLASQAYMRSRAACRVGFP